MSKNDTIVIIGGDLRQSYMAKILYDKGLDVVVYAIDQTNLDVRCKKARSLKEALNLGDIIIGPVPITRDQTHILSKEEKKDLKITILLEELHRDQIFIGGNIPVNLSQNCNEKNIPYFDFMKDENIAILNSIATAEGTILEAIRYSTMNLHGSKCLVLGYGKCATVIAKKLSSLDARVCVCARRLESLSSAQSFGYDGIILDELKDHISQFDYIINTIPDVVLTKELLEQLSLETTIIDIASSPGGVDYNYTKEKKLNAHLCLGLPGKVAPKTSANILVDAILKIIKKGSE